MQVRSDLATAVFDAVKAALDISFPFPQREVRILSDGAPQSTPVLAKPDDNKK
jgi:small-conductance mechanosensitive channel